MGRKPVQGDRFFFELKKKIAEQKRIRLYY
ncbi:hypothetical protein B14911_00075 [Bacillus sp. NRRL B-14911]|uniref:Uncharacterized protein n=1 Tax=Bacillus infantis NRRL B-14911 TaxID=1367477 RepID=U5L950_9BACI|nr:hypothetical protein N288_10060 [Bacillus infantis NRRL B-14911]EAR63329.1 hypothetical protein B14911_00075 [Bacillus sp. NRRL B-14911]